VASGEWRVASGARTFDERERVGARALGGLVSKRAVLSIVLAGGDGHGVGYEWRAASNERQRVRAQVDARALELFTHSQPVSQLVSQSVSEPVSQAFTNLHHDVAGALRDLEADSELRVVRVVDGKVRRDLQWQRATERRAERREGSRSLCRMRSDMREGRFGSRREVRTRDGDGAHRTRDVACRQRRVVDARWQGTERSWIPHDCLVQWRRVVLWPSHHERRIHSAYSI